MAPDSAQRFVPLPSAGHTAAPPTSAAARWFTVVFRVIIEHRVSLLNQEAEANEANEARLGRVRRLSLPSVCRWQIVLTRSLPPPQPPPQPSSRLKGSAALLPLHHLLVARDVSGVQQLVDGRVLREETRGANITQWWCNDVAVSHLQASNVTSRWCDSRCSSRKNTSWAP